MPDIIDTLSGTPSDLQELRRKRPDAVANAQKSFEALLEQESSLTYAERYAVAVEVARLHGLEGAIEFYEDLAEEEPASSSRLEAALDVVRLLVLSPSSSSPQVIGHLTEHFTEDEIVSLLQLVSFMAFQLRVIHGLRVLAGQPVGSGMQGQAPLTASWSSTDRVIEYPDLIGPDKFVRHSLGWKPWLKPLGKEELTEEHREALVRKDRIDSEYFRLLVRDPEALKARTLTDLDIFYNTDGGLGRAERELAATAASKVNGCIFCASVHSVRSADESGRGEDLDALLADVDADLGSPEWNAIRDSACRLTLMTFDSSDVEKLHALKFDDADIIDLINSAAFFNWANRLMLVLGEPELPRRFR